MTLYSAKTTEERHQSCMANRNSHSPDSFCEAGY